MNDSPDTPPPNPADAPPVLPVPDAQLAVLYLRGREAACAHCRYSLRNASTHVCPECGRANSIAELVTSASRAATRFAWLATVTLGIAGVVLLLGLFFLPLVIALAIMFPLLDRGQISWIVAGVVLMGTAFVWGLALVRMTSRLIGRPSLIDALRSGPGRRRGRVLASITSPAWLRLFVTLLSLFLTLGAGYYAVWVIYEVVSQRYYYSAQPQYFVWYQLFAWGQYVLWFLFSLAALIACIARLRRRDDLLRDGVVVGWLMMVLAIVPVGILLIWTLRIFF